MTEVGHIGNVWQLLLLLLWTLAVARTDEGVQSNCYSAFYSLPECIDQPNGYYCNCGPGFVWNSKLCIAAGVDSRMSFHARNMSYTSVDREIVSSEFTLSLWLRHNTNQGASSTPQGTVVSFNLPNKTNVLRVDLPGPADSLRLFYRGDSWTLPSSESVHTAVSWQHLVWTQKIERWGRVRWRVRLPGGTGKSSFRSRQSSLKAASLVPVKGEMLLGQYNSTWKSLRPYPELGFAGDVAHVNLWNYSMDDTEMERLHEDCTLNLCGNSIQWTQFRYGTQGSLHMRWPSGIREAPHQCKSPEVLVQSCDAQCSLRRGAQCKEEQRWNIRWRRSRANQTVTMQCPMDPPAPVAEGPRVSNGSSSSSTAPQTLVRMCQQVGRSETRWEDPDIAACVSHHATTLLEQINKLEKKMDRCILKDTDIIRGFETFINITSNIKMRNAIDLSLYIDSLKTLVELKERQSSQCIRFVMEMYEKRENVYHSHFKMIELALRSVAVLTHETNERAWNLTRPAGLEGRRLLQVMRAFLNMAAERTVNIVNKHDYTPREMSRLVSGGRLSGIYYKIEVHRWNEFPGTVFPNKADSEIMEEDYKQSKRPEATLMLARNFLREDDQIKHDSISNYIIVISALYRRLGRIAVNVQSMVELRRNNTGETQRMKHKINSDVMDIVVSIDGRTVEEVQPHSVEIYFEFHNNFNMSKPLCLQLRGDLNQYDIYSDSHLLWHHRCILSEPTNYGAKCICDNLGTVTIASDMFNDLWNKNKKRRALLAAPSYFGCVMSSLLCGVVAFMLFYLRTSGNTSSIHQNFSIAIVAAQMCYIIGIDKYEYELVCQAFSLLLHYFFLTCFAWLMNEAFNLYIVVTYAAHSHADESTDGSMWRFHLLGWIMPAILVSTVAGINREKYYAKEICWINEKDVWLFYGPAVAMIVVSILVLIFTAKEHHESSYTKNEKDNKAIINQTKAVWTQIILQCLAWSFAFISIILPGIIVKYLYCLFNCLQGAFYIVFYYLLNDEVQKLSAPGGRSRSRGDSRTPLPGTMGDDYGRYNNCYLDNAGVLIADGETRTAAMTPNDDDGDDEVNRDSHDHDNSLLGRLCLGPLRRTGITRCHGSSGGENGRQVRHEDSDFELITTV